MSPKTEKKDPRTLHLTQKVIYGRLRNMPDEDCETSQLFLKLLAFKAPQGRKSFLDEELETIEKLGYKIQIKKLYNQS